METLRSLPWRKMDLRQPYGGGAESDDACSFGELASPDMADAMIPTPTRQIPGRKCSRPCLSEMDTFSGFDRPAQLRSPSPRNDLDFSDLFAGGEPRARHERVSEMKHTESHSIAEDERGEFSVSFGEHALDERKAVGVDDFEICALVGQGAYGKVYLVRKISNGNHYAMKVMNKEDLAQTNNISYTLTERNILRNVRHPYIASLHYAFQTHGKVYLVMDFLNGGQLLFHIRREGCFSENAVKFYAAELVLALEFLHAQNIVHRDLKPENIMLDGDGHIGVTDFGLAKVNVTDKEGASTFCGTVEYMAPEIIKNEEHGYAVDWWALGVLMFDLLTGSPPFRHKNRKRLQDMIIRGKVRLPQYLQSETHSILKGLIQADPQKRLGSGEDGIAKIKQHPFFRGVDWDALERRDVKPPFKPSVTGIDDVSLFDDKYTNVKVTTESPGILEITQSQEEMFLGFSFARSLEGMVLMPEEDPDDVLSSSSTPPSALPPCAVPAGDLDTEADANPTSAC